MIPNSYTRNQFAGYLRNEVLFKVAETLEWQWETGEDVAEGAHTAQVIQLDGAASLNSPTVTVDALPAALNTGTPITFTGYGQVYTAARDAAAGATTVYLYPYVAAAMVDNTVGAYDSFTPAAPKNIHPYLFAIVDETLAQLGYTDISQVSGAAAIKRLRQMGRIEAWRAVASHNVGSITDTSENTVYQKQQNFTFALQQMGVAIQEFNQDYGAAPVTFLPETTHSGTVKAVW